MVVICHNVDGLWCTFHGVFLSAPFSEGFGSFVNSPLTPGFRVDLGGNNISLPRIYWYISSGLVESSFRIPCIFGPSRASTHYESSQFNYPQRRQKLIHCSDILLRVFAQNFQSVHPMQRKDQWVFRLPCSPERGEISRQRWMGVTSWQLLVPGKKFVYPEGLEGYLAGIRHS